MTGATARRGGHPTGHPIRQPSRQPAPRQARPLALRAPAVLALALVSVVGVAAFAWPFATSNPQVLAHANDAPWLFAVLLGLLTLVLLAETTAGGLDAKTVAVLGVLAASGGALRVLSAGTSGVEPMFFLLVVAARVLGPGAGLVLGSAAMATGAFLTGGVGPWLPFQMLAAGWVALGAALVPVPRRAGPRAEALVLAGYGLLAGLAYGACMNLWFWPFMLPGQAPDGAGFVAGAPLATNLRHYAVFYVVTSLGWDLPRGLLTAALTLVAGPALLRTLRRALRRAAFDAPVAFVPPTTPGTDAATPAVAATPAPPHAATPTHAVPPTTPGTLGSPRPAPAGPCAPSAPSDPREAP